MRGATARGEARRVVFAVRLRVLASVGALLLLLLSLQGCAGMGGEVRARWPWPGRGEAPAMQRAKGGSGAPAPDGDRASSSRTRRAIDEPSATDRRAALAVEAIRKRGHVFGTDGTLQGLYLYATDRHLTVPAGEARPGDLLFFDTSDDGRSCGSHVGVVESAAPGGALKFREWRDGRAQLSHIHPGAPRARRDTDGRLMNSYLRRIGRDDPPGTRYTAGEMLCRVVRIR